MSVTSKQEPILEYIRNTTIPLINGAGDYNLTIKTVSRNFRTPDELDLSDYPATFIVDDESTLFTPLTAREFTTGSTQGKLTDGWIIGLYSYVEINTLIGKTNTGDMEIEIHKIMSDVMIAMANDYSLGGNCLAVTLITNHNSLMYSEKGIGINFQRYSVKYDFNPSVGIT